MWMGIWFHSVQKFGRICIGVHKFTCLYLCACKWASFCLLGLYICLCVISFSVHSLGNVNVNWEMLIVERKRQMKRNRDKVNCAKSTNTICIVATLGVYT